MNRYGTFTASVSRKTSAFQPLASVSFFSCHFCTHKMKLSGGYIVHGLNHFTLPIKMNHEVKEHCRKLHICGLHELYSLSNIIRVIKSRIM